jgi:hypothetical protein
MEFLNDLNPLTSVYDMQSDRLNILGTVHGVVIVLLLVEVVLTYVTLGGPTFLTRLELMLNAIIVLLSFMWWLVESVRDRGRAHQPVALAVLAVRLWDAMVELNLKQLKTLMRPIAWMAVAMRGWLLSLVPIVIIAGVSNLACAALGMELFGGYVFPFAHSEAHSATARGSFNVFLPGPLGYGALLTMFQITSAPNWHEVMHMTIHGGGNLWAALFFVATVILGIIFTYLSAATIYSNMQDLSDALQQKQDTKKAAGVKSNASVTSEIGPGAENAFDASIRMAHADMKSPARTQTAMFIRPNTPLRLLIHQYVDSPYSTILRMALVAAQALMLAAEYPKQSSCSESEYLQRQCQFRNPVESFPQVDNALIALHAIEIVIQVLADGLIMHQGAYLRSVGNVLDFFILFISIVAKSVVGCALQNKVCEFLLWFRPLRVLRVMHFVQLLRKVAAPV